MRAAAPVSDIRTSRIFYQASPVILARWSANMMAAIDLAMISPLGANAVAALALVGALDVGVTAVFHGLNRSLQTFVAAADTEVDTLQIRARYLSTAVLWSVAAALVLMVLVTVLAPAIIPIMTRDTSIQSMAIDYLLWRCLLGLIPSGASTVFRGYWLGIQKSHMLMVAVPAKIAVNILFNWILIYGKFGCPALGVRGAAIATGLAVWVEATIHFVAYRRQGHGCKWRLFGYDLWLRLNKLGLPIMSRFIMESACATAAYGMIGHLGTNELAVMHAVTVIFFFVRTIFTGIARVSQSMLAEAVNQCDYERAGRILRRTRKAMMLALLATLGPLNLYPDFVLSVFLPGDELLSMTIILLRCFTVVCIISIVPISNSALMLASKRGVADALVTGVVSLTLFLAAVYAGVFVFRSVYGLAIGLILCEMIHAAVHVCLARKFFTRRGA